MSAENTSEYSQDQTHNLAGYILIPRAAWISIPRNAKIITITGDLQSQPMYLSSVQDTSSGTILVVCEKPISRGKIATTTISADSISELWKYIPDACQMELLILLDVIHEQSQTVSALQNGTEQMRGNIARLTESTNATSSQMVNLDSAFQRRINTLEASFADVRRDMTELRRQMESLTKLTKTLLPTTPNTSATPTPTLVRPSTDEIAPEFGDQFGARSLQRRQIIDRGRNRQSTTDRMWTPPSDEWQ